MFRVITVTSDGAVRESTDLADVAPPPEGGLRWIDLQAQDEAQMRLLEERFRFHPLAIEDCLHVDQRAKLEEYDDHVFIVTHALRCIAAGDPRELEIDELHAFLGRSYLVTVHLSPIDKVDEVWKRALNDAAVLRRGVDQAYYLVADAIVDSHFTKIDLVNDQLEDMEEAMFRDEPALDMQSLFALRHSLLMMRRTVSPQRDVFAVLSRRGGDQHVSDRTALYFRDVYDHLVRIYESIDAARDLLGATLEAYRSMVAQRTNEIMKSLTILSAVFLPLTFVTGFFGQNFEHLPFKSDALMYSMVIACAAIPLGMLFWFRSKRWL